MANSKEIYWKRRADGYCGQCGAVKIIDGAMCERCRAKRKAAYRQKKMLSLCQTCGKPCSALRCEPCRIQFNKLRGERYKKTRAENKCNRCNSSVESGRAYCDPCKAKNDVYLKMYTAKKIASGVCVKCGKGKVVSTGRYCEPCKAHRRDIRKNYVKKKKETGVCINCTKPAAMNRALCEYHLAYHRNRVKKEKR